MRKWEGEKVGIVMNSTMWQFDNSEMKELKMKE